MDSAPPQPARLSPLIVPSETEEAVEPRSVEQSETSFSQLCGQTIESYWRTAQAESVDLTKAELAAILLEVGAKYNFGLLPGVTATRSQAIVFFDSLQLEAVALARACALGRDRAWQSFLNQYRQPLTQAAIALTASASLGKDLADSLYSEMFGLSTREGERRSPLAGYAGRGSLMGFLRTTLAQRHVDHHRRTHREVPLDQKDFASASQASNPSPELLASLTQSLTAILRSLGAEDRFLISSWYLDQRTLLEIAQVLGVHEATISRKLKRITSRLHKDLLDDLRKAGLSGHAAAEALGVDPRDLTINLRILLQNSHPAPFLHQEPQPESGIA